MRCKVKTDRCLFPAETGNHVRCVSDKERCGPSSGESDSSCPGQIFNETYEDNQGHYYCQLKMDTLEVEEKPWGRCIPDGPCFEGGSKYTDPLI